MLHMTCEAELLCTVCRPKESRKAGLSEMNDHDQILKVQSDDVDTRLSSAGLNSTLCTASSCPFNSTTNALEVVSNTCV